jgi:hypothetical protein
MKSAMSGDPTPSPSSGGSSSGLTPAVLPYPIPHIPPFPSPTLVQPLAQLRQPYLLSLTSQTLGTNYTYDIFTLYEAQLFHNH